MHGPIHILILQNGSVARREVFFDSPVGFGRDPSNRVVLQERTASRKHGEVRIESDRWVVANLSPNGTRLNGREIGKKPRTLKPGDTIEIGDTPVIRVEFDGGAETPPPAEADADADTPAAPKPSGAAMSRRAKVWVSIGVYLMLMLCLFIFFSTLGERPDDRLQSEPELTPAAIESDVRRLPTGVAVDPRAAADSLRTATQYFEKLQSDPTNLYRAHEAYQQALAASGKATFDNSVDQSRFLDVEERLIDQVKRIYRESYVMLMSRQYKAAEQSFRRLNKEVYLDSGSEVFKNAEKQLRIAQTRQAKKKWY
ncbi:MAG: FHA domain-containing protein [Planctomycetes bacterium]|nr:FHA domain-containing protein [Planctomycetota bacterium]